jgi:hypothetical protein
MSDQLGYEAGPGRFLGSKLPPKVLADDPYRQPGLKKRIRPPLGIPSLTARSPLSANTDILVPDRTSKLSPVAHLNEGW